MQTNSQRTILHLDMNAFFASVEQTANPFIRYKPIGVGSAKSYAGAALLAISYEAKARGVKKFMRYYEAKGVCPELIAVPFDPLKYYSVNRQIMNILREYTPQMEVYSIDEAFLDLTDVLHLHKKSAVEIAQEIKQRIRDEVGCKLTSSVGIAPNKLLAKVGSDWKKPDGLTVINWDNRFEYLDNLEIGDIWGIGFRGTAKLTELGIKSTADIRKLSDANLHDLVGTYYTRLRMIANGEHFDQVNPHRAEKAAKSMQHAHTLSSATNNREELKTVIRKMSERLAVRLRRHHQTSSVVYLGLRPEKVKTYGWGSLPSFHGFEAIGIGTTNGRQIYEAACRVFDSLDLGSTKIRLVAVGVSSLQSTEALVFDIFQNPQLNALDSAVDDINRAYGEFTVRSADIVYQYAKESELHVVREDMTFHPSGGYV